MRDIPKGTILACLALAASVHLPGTKTYGRDYSRQFDGLIESLRESQQRLDNMKEIEATMFRKFNNGAQLIKKGDRIGGCRDLRIAAELNQNVYSRKSAELTRLNNPKAEELRATYYVYHNEYQELIASLISQYC